MSLVKFAAAAALYPPPTVSHSHEGIGKPRKTHADTVGHSLWDLIFVIDISITNTNLQSSTSRSPVRYAPASTQLSGHLSKYWPRTSPFDLGDRQSRAPTAHPPLSVCIPIAKNTIHEPFFGNEVWVSSKESNER